MCLLFIQIPFCWCHWVCCIQTNNERSWTQRWFWFIADGNSDDIDIGWMGDGDGDGYGDTLTHQLSCSRLSNTRSMCGTAHRAWCFPVEPALWQHLNKFNVIEASEGKKKVIYWHQLRLRFRWSSLGPEWNATFHVYFPFLAVTLSPTIKP